MQERCLFSLGPEGQAEQNQLVQICWWNESQALETPRGLPPRRRVHVWAVI